MRYLKGLLEKDAAQAELITQCKRRGTAFRILDSKGEGTLNFAVNGGGFMCLGQSGDCCCAHAEVSAIMELLRTTVELTGSGLIGLSTLSPCPACAHVIVKSGMFSRIEYLREYDDARGINILWAGKVDCFRCL